MQEVTRYVATDGKEFDTEQLCKVYEDMLAIRKEAEDFAHHSNGSFSDRAAKAIRTRTVNTIAAFFAWRQERKGMVEEQADA